MNTIYLRDENYKWQPHKYEKIEDLADVLKANKITVGDYAYIGSNASIGAGASIGERAYIGAGAFIGDYVSIGSGASIGAGVELIRGFYLTGSKHGITYVGEGKLSIGCYTKTIAEWLEVYEEVGMVEGYDLTEIKEYHNYIKLAEQFYKTIQ